MRWAEGFIAADWGTTNRRAWRIGADGAVEEEFEDGRGVLSIEPGGFPEAVAQLRERLGTHPMLLAGMVGSNRGWAEAPYVPCPASFEALVAGLKWVADDIAIVPGVSFLEGRHADVMRGEEVQLLGAVDAELVGADGLVCHPGTHNKWAVVEQGRIARFRTVMTGELFSLLKRHSILSDLLQGPDEPDEGFAAGVAHGLEADDLTAELFSVRARTLLGQAGRDTGASYVSGLLIGADVRIGISAHAASDIAVMGSPELTRLYAAALKQAGRAPIEVDGERSFLAGIVRIAERIA